MTAVAAAVRHRRLWGGHGRFQIGVTEVVALEQQRLVRLGGQRVGEAVAQVEAAR